MGSTRVESARYCCKPPSDRWGLRTGRRSSQFRTGRALILGKDRYGALPYRANLCIYRAIKLGTKNPELCVCSQIRMQSEHKKMFTSAKILHIRLDNVLIKEE